MEPTLDTVLDADAGTLRLEATEESTRLLEEARQSWSALAPYRERRARARDFYWGDQWRERIEGKDGGLVKEEDYIRSEGRIPWRMNQIAPVVHNLKGQYRQNQSERQAFGVDRRDDEAAEMVTLALRAERRRNRSKTLEAYGFQEHLIGGMVAFRLGFKWWPEYQEESLLVQRCQMSKFFYNPDLQDPRLLDLRLIGELHDLTLDEVIVSFGRNEEGVYDEARMEALRRLYGGARERHFDYLQAFGFEHHDSVSFDYADSYGLCRVVEVWTKKLVLRRYGHDPLTGRMGRIVASPEEVARVNALRGVEGLPAIESEVRAEEVWCFHYLAPGGEVLLSGETPYRHGSHPFVLGFADLFDGQTRGIVDDLIDQQRLYNRMIIQIDEMMTTAAKGLLMIPEEFLPDGACSSTA